MKIRKGILISLPLLLVAAGLRAEVLPFNLELGYRWVQVDGNRGVYRSQINERAGLSLRVFDFSTPDFSISSRDLGIGPTSAMRIETSKSGIYKLRVGYRQMDAFSALPSAQHTLDRTRTMVDADLEFLPGARIAPFVGYSWNRNTGPGSTTYFLGQDEFRLTQDLNERDRELRAGATFQFARFQGQFTQGWRRFRGSESLVLAEGAGAGNNNNPVLGSQIFATTATRFDNTSVNTPFTNLYIAGEPLSRVRLIGNYTRFSATSDGSGDEDLTGSFVSFAIGQNFLGVNETSSGRAKNQTWRGGGRAEITLARGIDFITSFQREHRELTGSSLINTVYLTPGDVQTLLTSANALDRDEKLWTAGISARAFGPFAFRAEFRQSQQDFMVSQDLAEIVIPGSQSGDYARRVNTIDAGVSYAKKGFSVVTSVRSDHANNPVFRTDFIERTRYRARAGWRNSLVGFGLSGEETKQSNDTSFDGKMRQATADLLLTPNKYFQLRGSASRYQSDTSIITRAPQNFLLSESIHAEKGTSYEGGVGVFYKKVSFDGGYTRFRNTGNLPFDIYRYQTRATLDLKGHTGLAAEWNRDKYRQRDFTLSDFNADRFGLYLRWTP